MSEEKDLMSQLEEACLARVKRMDDHLPLDFSNIKDYLATCITANTRIAEHGLNHIPMSCYRNVSYDTIEEDLIENQGVVTTALMLAMSMIPGEQKEQFRTLLVRQLRLDLLEEVQKRKEAAKQQGMGLAEMLTQFLRPGKNPHGGGDPGSTH